MLPHPHPANYQSCRTFSATHAAGDMSDATVCYQHGKCPAQCQMNLSLTRLKSAKCKKKGVQCLGYTKPLRYFSHAITRSKYIISVHDINLILSPVSGVHTA